MENKKIILILGIIFLISIIRINLITLNTEMVSAQTLTSSINVSYDTELKTQFLLSDWVHITVKIRDNTNISISQNDSIEIQKQKDELRSSILSDISDSILSNLSKNEFELGGKFPIGNGFYGNITPEGFNKLLRDPRVEHIYAEKNLQINSTLLGKNLIIYILPIILVTILVIILLIRIKKWKRKK